MYQDFCIFINICGTIWGGIKKLHGIHEIVDVADKRLTAAFHY